MAALTVHFSEGSVESNESTSFPTRPVEPVTSTTFFRLLVSLSFDFSDDDMVVVLDEEALSNALRVPRRTR